MFDNFNVNLRKNEGFLTQLEINRFAARAARAARISVHFSAVLHKTTKQQREITIFYTGFDDNESIQPPISHFLFWL